MLQERLGVMHGRTLIVGALFGISKIAPAWMVTRAGNTISHEPVSLAAGFDEMC